MNITSSPRSPRRYLCELDFSKIAEQNDFLLNSPKRSKREKNRSQWLQLIVKFKKFHSLQPVYKYLRNQEMIHSFEKVLRKIYFSKFITMYKRQKWIKFSLALIDDNRIHVFQNHLKKMREIRTKQTIKHLIYPESEFLTANFDHIVNTSISHSLFEPISLYAQKKNAELLSGDDTNPPTLAEHLFRKDAWYLYLVFAIVGITFGIYLYHSLHENLYHFLNKPK